MMNILLEYKWFILISCEIIAWLATFYMFYARYWLGSKLKFIISTVITILAGYIPHIGIGIMNFIQYRELDGFTLVIIGLFIFGFIFGKKLVIKMDRAVQTWVANKRGQQVK